MAGTDFSTTFFYHPACFVIPKKLKCTNARDFLQNVVEDNDDILNPDRLEELVAALETSATAAASATKKKKDAKDDILTEIRAAYEKSHDGTDEPATKKAKDPLARAVDLYGKHHSKTLDQLKDYLRYNKQVLGGTKPFVLFKVIDGEENGRLGVCPLCQGRLKFETNSKTVVCSGQFDETTQTRIPCTFSSSQQVRRTDPVHTGVGGIPDTVSFVANRKPRDSNRGLPKLRRKKKRPKWNVC